MTRLGIDRVWLTAARQEEPLMRGDGALLKRELKVAAAEQLTVPVKIAVGDKESETLLVGCDLVCLQMAGSAVTLGKMIPVQESCWAKHWPQSWAAARGHWFLPEECCFAARAFFGWRIVPPDWTGTAPPLFRWKRFRTVLGAVFPKLPF